MARSLKKGPYIDPKLLRKIQMMNARNEKKIIKTWARDCQIPPEFIGHTIAVHNGKQHIPIFIAENMVGHHLGEFSLTRKFKAHGGRLAREAAAATSAPAAGATVGASPATPVAGAPTAKPAGK